MIAAGISNVIVFDGIRYLGPARATAFQFLVPLFTVLIGALVLSEPITAGQVVGGLVIVVGVLLTRRERGLRPVPHVVAASAAGSAGEPAAALADPGRRRPG